MAYMTRGFWILLLLAMCLSLPAQGANEQVDLRPSFVPGQGARYGYWSTYVQDITIELFGQQESVRNVIESQGEMDWTVRSVAADGQATCEMRYQWLSFDWQNSEGDESHNDSRDGQGDMEVIHDLLVQMVDQPITFVINREGEVDRVEGLAAIEARLSEPEAMPEELSFIQSVLSGAYVHGGPAEVRVGHQWSTTMREVHQLGYLDRQTQWTLDRVEVMEGIPVAVISGVSTYRFEPDADAGDARVDLLRGEGRSQVLYDLQRGEVVARHGSREVELAIQLPLGEGQTMRQHFVERQQSQSWREAEFDAP